MLTITIPFFIFFIHNPLSIVWVHHIVINYPLFSELFISMHEYIKAVFVPLQYVICRPTNNYTRFVSSYISYNSGLSNKKLIVRWNNFIYIRIIIVIKFIQQTVRYTLLMFFYILRRKTGCYSS